MKDVNTVRIGRFFEAIPGLKIQAPKIQINHGADVVAWFLEISGSWFLDLRSSPGYNRRHEHQVENISPHDFWHPASPIAAEHKPISCAAVASAGREGDARSGIWRSERPGGASGSCRLDIRRGTNELEGGVIEADQLLLTNRAGSFEFNGGLLITRGAFVSNNAPFVV